MQLLEGRRSGGGLIRESKVGFLLRINCKQKRKKRKKKTRMIERWNKSNQFK